MRAHTLGELVWRQTSQAVARAAELERTAALEVLGLEVERVRARERR